MQQPYWVRNIYVDPTRNEMTKLAEVVSVQPKVMAVLNLLAANQGQVVDHDKIMQVVWPDVFVTPNTLQRCIAELRKVFADDRCQQQAIKTHPKVGYSLELSVSYSKPVTLGVNKKNILGVAATSILLLAIVTSDVFFKSDFLSKPLTLLPLTASDEREYYPGYSPEGNLLIFHRYKGVCKNHLWAKDLEKGTEYRLTKKAGIYEEQSWLPEQESIFYSVQENCMYDATQAPCWTIHGLNVKQALLAPQSGESLFSCGSERISSPMQLDQNSILFLRGDDPNKLHLFSLKTSTQRVFYQRENTVIESFAFAPESEQIALITRSNAGHKSLLLLDKTGQLIDQKAIELPSDIDIRHVLSVKFDNTGTALLFAATKGLYKLDLSGRISYIDMPGYEKIRKPAFHPQDNKLVFTSGSNDADVVVVSTDNNRMDYQTLARSTAYDVDGLFQPDSENIAFLSRRSGTHQIWLWAQNKVRQLSQFQYDTRISGFGWSPKGDSIAVVSNNRLYLIKNAIQKEVTTPLAVLSFHHWISDRHHLLTVQTEQGTQLVKFDIQSGLSVPLHSGLPFWARQIDNSTTLYLDKNKYLYKLEAGQVMPEKLSALPLKSKRYVWHDRALWGIDEDHNLWRYALEKQQTENITQLEDSTWWLSDIKQERLLITKLVSITNQVIEATPR